MYCGSGSCILFLYYTYMRRSRVFSKEKVRKQFTMAYKESSVEDNINQEQSEKVVSSL